MLADVSVSVELLEIIARAAPLGDRASGDYFDRHPGQDPELASRRAAEWADALTDGDPARLGRILAELGLDGASFERALADVVVRDPERLPDWGRALASLWDDAGSPEAGERLAVEVVLTMRLLYMQIMPGADGGPGRYVTNRVPVERELVLA